VAAFVTPAHVHLIDVVDSAVPISQAGPAGLEGSHVVEKDGGANQSKNPVPDT
jgi:hypothetical protein